MGLSWPSLSSTALPFSGGVYLLTAELKKGCRLKVGSLGRHIFPMGFYLYVGSAQRNLIQRLRRHVSGQSNGKKLHWHIDYLLAHTRIRSIWGFAAPKEWECRLGRRLAGLRGSKTLLKGFGSSDCSCMTHLYYFPNIYETRVPEGSPNTEPVAGQLVRLSGSAYGMTATTTCEQARTLHSIFETRTLEKYPNNLCHSNPPGAEKNLRRGKLQRAPIPQNGTLGTDAVSFGGLRSLVEEVSPKALRGFYCEPGMDDPLERPCEYERGL
ncbi:MAG: DUF123 domain-containing protein [Candidatus Brocadiales bacterium]